VFLHLAVSGTHFLYLITCFTLTVSKNQVSSFLPEDRPPPPVASSVAFALQIKCCVGQQKVTLEHAVKAYGGMEV
jgi:hypothetical protein